VTASTRRILLVAHPTKRDVHALAADVAQRLTAAGVEVLADQLLAAELDGEVRLVDLDDPADSCELVVVLGGDGTILRAAELCRGRRVPLLGVNLGHVGFLAEAEVEDLDATVDRIVARDYTVEERIALEVTVTEGGRAVFSSWALNEVSVEKASRARMIELAVEVDGRPLSSWGCDGVVLATPTGSTAYALSAGGPVVWPNVEAMLLVPISAHALFARPVVVGTRSVLAVEILADSEVSGVLACDGRRTVDIAPGARVQVTRSAEPVRLARLDTAPFTDRIVAKFDLSVEGWRGRDRSEAERGRADGVART
jgi:NAD+ kinase